MKLLLVDGNSFIYKAFYAIRGLSNRAGLPTNAIYGFRNILEKCHNAIEPDGIVVVFDAPGPTFRHESYPQYKAQRQKAPEDLIAQIPWIHRLVEAQGLKRLCIEGFEADDVIGTITCQAQDAGYREVYIATSDKDLGQLLTKPGVFLYDTSKERILDAAAFHDKMGVTPAQVIDYLALVGDASDNIPGVKGIGPKSAQKLLEQYGTLDDIYAHVDEISGAVGKRLQEFRDDAFLSRRLLELHTSVPLDDRDFRPGVPNVPELYEIYSELGFQGLRDKLNYQVDAPPAAAVATDIDVRIADTAEAFAELLHEAATAAVIAIDTETTSEHAVEADLVGISIAIGEQAWYVPVDHAHTDIHRNMPTADVQKLITALDRSDLLLVGQNIKYDLIVLQRHDMALPQPRLFDTMIASYLLDANRRSHGLDQLAVEFLSHEMIAFKDVVPKGSTFRDVDIPTAARYAGEDAAITLALYNLFAPRIEQEYHELFHAIEMPLVRVLCHMEMLGIAVDREMLGNLHESFTRRLHELEEKIYELAGEAFNINSPKQLATLLFEKMGIPPVKKTKTGYSTDVSVLEALAPQYEIANVLTQYRMVSKLLSTYVNALSELINPWTGRIHTSFNQTVANTGRLSSSDPNLQNIPIRTEEGREVRKAFVPAPGFCFVAADYSQIELRIAAHLSGDESMLKSFAEEKDIHAQTADAIFGSSEPNYRRMAKAVNFGILYGISAFKLSRDLGMTPKEGQALIDSYFLRYPGVKAYIDHQIAFAREHGYAQTLYGRRRYLPDINSRNRNIREAAERNAVNMPIQGTSADIIKIAMNRIHQQLAPYQARMLLQIHDELLFEVPFEQAEPFSAFLQEQMESAAQLKVKLTVTVSSGNNWNDVH